MKYLIVLSILTLTLFLSCKSHKKANENPKTGQKEARVVPKEQSQPSVRPEKILEYKKGACHGRCPIYTMTFLSDGTVYYEGIQFSKKMGIHSLKIAQNEIDDIINRCRNEDFSKFPTQYKSMIPDWASSTIIYYGDLKPKSVTWRDEATPFLKSLAETIENIEKQSGWKLQGNQAAPNNAVPNQIIVEMEQSVHPKGIIAKYRKFGIKLIKDIAPKRNLYLIGYDGAKISAYEMLNLLQQDDDVSFAEFNLKVSPRG